MRQVFVAIALILAALPVAAADVWTPDKDGVCNQQTTTVAIMDCLGKRAKFWDGRLNVAYQEALKDADNPTHRDALVKAQRAWVAYRNANCNWYGSQEGTIRETSGALCMRDMTQSRAIELQQRSPQ